MLPLSDFPSESVSPTILRGPHLPDLLRPEILADVFEATAARTPGAMALVWQGHTLNYGELDALANNAASHLLAAGVHAGQIVGLWLPRGQELLVMQLAIAKTGAAWLPLDADTPAERVLTCLEDAQSPGIITLPGFAEQLQAVQPDLRAQCWTPAALIAPAPTPMRRGDVHPEHPAYVIYTSGSTGRPKGIAITQGSICHFLRSENSRLGVRASDRVYQGFSVAFDMSFEEIWISYLVGATLWIASKEVGSDVESLPSLLQREGITVLHAVPTLLGLFSQDIPSLRLINLGGEMCPPALVERWARAGRRVFNTYGPTEATVSASLAELRAGEPVTIGEPLPNYGLLVVEADGNGPLALVPQGDTGELCITGPGVAAGYLGRPDLTAEKFLPNPWASGPHDQRLYRTGDLARITPEGQVQCLGRTDDQVKIRGFRVELGEIESALCDQAGVAAAAVVLRQEDGVELLIAYMVAETGTTPDPQQLRHALGQRLPAYMVPGHIDTLAAMPRLPSGKIDRKQLKARPLTLAAAPSGSSDTPVTAGEQALFGALAQLFPGQSITRGADFFRDLSGHSLYAARLASRLRTQAGYTHVTVRDIYQNRTVGAIAQAMDAPRDTPTAVDSQWTPPAAWKRWRCGIAQAAMLPWLVTIRMAQWMAPFFVYNFYTGDADDSTALAIGASVLAYLLATVLEFALAIAAKWLLVGRQKAGSYPLWGLAYFRWWLSDRLLEGAPVYLLSGSSMYNWWLRALGARVGRDVVIGSTTLRAPDLLHIGDGCSIGNAVNLENARVEHGHLILGPIHVGDNSMVGSYAVLEGGTALEPWAHLEGQSALRQGRTVPARRIWSGSPAQDMGEFDPQAQRPRPPVTRLRQSLENIYYVLGALLIATLFFLPVFPGFTLMDWIDNIDRFPWLETDDLRWQLLKYFVLAFPAAAGTLVCTALLSAAIRWTVLPRLRPGSWPVHSRLYCAKWLVNQIQESSLQVVHGVYATLYAPWWYRLLGAKVGRDAEISSALGVVPDMLTLGDETFIADAVMLGDEHIDGGWMTMRPTVISKRSFVGNGAYVPDGTTLPEGVLIGVHSSAPANERMRSGDTWLGSPPLHLPAREETSGFPERLTFKPAISRRLVRGIIEGFRIVAPHAIVTSVGYTIVLRVMPLAGDGQWMNVVSYLTVSGLLYGLGTFLFVVVLKWLLMGRYQKRSTPMWTPFVWLSEAVTNLFEGIAVPNFMRYLRGTPWLPVAFRLLGCKIGKGVYMDTTDITEFDCVSIGDYSELNALTCPQTHLFEDRIMKIDHVQIGSRVYLGPRAAVLYSAEVGDGAWLGPLTLVMKGENIPAASRWSGCPAAPAQA